MALKNMNLAVSIISLILHHTHPLGGVDVYFGGYDLWSIFWPKSLGQNSLVLFNIADIWRAVPDHAI